MSRFVIRKVIGLISNQPPALSGIRPVVCDVGIFAGRTQCQDAENIHPRWHASASRPRFTLPDAKDGDRMEHSCFHTFDTLSVLRTRRWLSRADRHREISKVHFPDAIADIAADCANNWDPSYPYRKLDQTEARSVLYKAVPESGLWFFV
jgi:hypothetical protein